MALIVEDGTGLPNSECYCTVAELDDYITKRNLDSSWSEAEKEAAIRISAQDWIDGQHTFAGDPVNPDQAMSFPTTAFDGVPKDIVTANVQAAYLQLEGVLLVDYGSVSQGGAVISEDKGLKTGMYKKTTYEEGTNQIYGRVLPPSLINLLKPYLDTAVSGLGQAVRRW